MSRHRAYCFTINNPSNTDRFAVSVLFNQCKYGIVGDEVGEQGTAHLQGYVHLRNPLSLKKLKYYLPRAHLTVSLGNDEQNKAYCSKEGTNIKEVGETSEGQGFRTDL